MNFSLRNFLQLLPLQTSEIEYLLRILIFSYIVRKFTTLNESRKSITNSEDHIVGPCAVLLKVSQKDYAPWNYSRVVSISHRNIHALMWELSIVYSLNTRNYWVLGLCLSSGILMNWLRLALSNRLNRVCVSHSVIWARRKIHFQKHRIF
jgi:hypothetical protein